MMSTTIRGLLFLVLSTLLYSLMPLMIRTLGAGQIPPISQVFLRYTVAFAAALLYFRITKGKIVLRKEDLAVLGVVTIFGYALTNLFFTYAALLTEISSVLFIFYCFSIIAPLLGFIFLKERISRANLLGLIIIFLALLFLFQPNSLATWKIGALFALLSALGQSIYIVGRKKLATYSSSFLLLASTFSGVLVVGLLALVIENRFYFGSGPGGISTIEPRYWIVTAAFGLNNFAAWLLMSKGFRLVSTSSGSLVMLLENIFAILFAFLFFREQPTLTTILGGMLILGSATMVILSERLQVKQ